MNASISNGDWFHVPKVRPEAPVQLVCFPSAGSGASMFTHWADLFGRDVEIVAVQPPGRERRVNEAPIGRLVDYARAVSAALTGVIDRDYVIFGHSMGALVAYEALVSKPRALSEPRLVVLSAAVPRSDAIAVRSEWRDASPGVLVDHLRMLGGTPDEVLGSQDLMDYLHPPIVNDLAATAEYFRTPAVPLPGSVLIVSGDADQTVSDTALHDWDELFASKPDHLRLPGGHFYFSNQQQARRLADIILTALELDDNKGE